MAGVVAGVSAGWEEQAARNAPANTASTDRLIKAEKVIVVTFLDLGRDP